jgi:hypothetical protein
VLAAVWEAAGYPWSVRLKALLPAVGLHRNVVLEQIAWLGASAQGAGAVASSAL